MSKYYNFNDFMDDVLDEADEISKRKHGYGIDELFKVKVSTVNAIHTLITRGGWTVFIAVVALLVLGPVAFVAALSSFLSTPPGWIVAGIFGFAAVKTIRSIYVDRILPINVRKVGNAFKPRWKELEGNRVKIDSLCLEAANELYQSAFDDLK